MESNGFVESESILTYGSWCKQINDVLHHAIRLISFNTYFRYLSFVGLIIIRRDFSSLIIFLYENKKIKSLILLNACISNISLIAA